MDIIVIMLISFFVAALFSLLGLGGGIIYTPLFFWAGLPLLAAIPMALLLNTISAAGASMAYLKQRLVDMRIAVPLIVTSIPGALAGSYLAQKVNTEILVLLLSIIIFLASIRILFFSNQSFPPSMSENNKAVVCAVSGFIIGVIASLIGIGGGTFIVPLLMVLGYETKNATPTSTFAIAYISASGFVGYMILGTQQLDITLLLYAGAAAFTGAQIGSRIIFSRTSSRTIEQLFALVLLLVAGKLLYGVT